ncbi:hypothetical protein [Brevibacillus sp. SYSU BS000544]|uniref:hypothetical protein n=1 Tax=Brevibacillus sp. SYSU BS000544 TaxID=3416443 RepID=UPI003CE50FCD
MEWFVLFMAVNPHDIMVMIVWATPITYLYGISVSLVIDWAVRRWEIQSNWKVGHMYLFAGCLFFGILYLFGVFGWEIMKSSNRMECMKRL